MRNVIPCIVLVGLAVMLYCGRVTSWVGGGVVVPQVSARFAHQGDPSRPTMVVTNTGREELNNLRVAVDHRDLGAQRPVRERLAPGESCAIPLADLRGRPVYLFADRHPLPAAFVVPEQ